MWRICSSRYPANDFPGQMLIRLKKFFVVAFIDKQEDISLHPQFSSVAKSCLTLRDPMDRDQASLSITNSRSLLKLMSIELVMPSNHLILCHPLILPSIFPSIRVFSSESILHIRRPKYWGFSFSMSPSNKYSGLTSFSIDWFDLLAVQETQEFSPPPQFESISSLVLSLLYGPTLTSIRV